MWDIVVSNFSFYKYQIYFLVRNIYLKMSSVSLKLMIYSQMTSICFKMVKKRLPFNILKRYTTAKETVVKHFCHKSFQKERRQGQPFHCFEAENEIY